MICGSAYHAVGDALQALYENSLRKPGNILHFTWKREWVGYCSLSFQKYFEFFVKNFHFHFQGKEATLISESRLCPKMGN